jgi:hypothetical protein
MPADTHLLRIGAGTSPYLSYLFSTSFLIKSLSGYSFLLFLAAFALLPGA